MSWVNLLAVTTVAIVCLKWLFALSIFGRFLGQASMAMYRQAMHSNLRFYLGASLVGIVLAPLSAWLDLAPPGIPLLSFLFGLTGVGTLGLPPSFLLVGNSRMETYGISWILNAAAPLSRIVHLLLPFEGYDPTQNPRNTNKDWKARFYGASSRCTISGGRRQRTPPFTVAMGTLLSLQSCQWQDDHFWSVHRE